MVNDSIPDIVTITEMTSKNSNSNDISESDGNNLNKIYAGLNQRVLLTKLKNYVKNKINPMLSKYFGAFLSKRTIPDIVAIITKRVRDTPSYHL